jgi:hypothetical protein
MASQEQDAIFYHAFYNVGIRSQLGIMYISYNTFLCLPCRGTTGHMAYLWRLIWLPCSGAGCDRALVMPLVARLPPWLGG